ncbi:MAG: hypothetical protein QXN71_00075 [Candidatus Aenigmatarchaeota archaeon]
MVIKRFQKGQMYSAIAILIMIPIVVFVAYYITASQNIKLGVTEKVIADQQQQVAKGIEDDFERAMKISGRRALLSAVNKVVISGSFLDNSTLRIGELMLNSTIYGNPSILMANNTLGEWKSRIISQNHSFNIDVNFTNLTVKNYDGMHIEVSMILTLNVSDKLNISRIDRVLDKKVLVSVEGLEDPVYTLSTEGYVKKTIRSYPYPYFTRKFQGTINSGNCSGNSTYDVNDPNPGYKIVIIQNTTGIPDSTLQGFKGVVVEEDEDLNSKGVSCFVSGVENAVEIPENKTVWIDNLTASLWLLPIIEGAKNTYYYKGVGPNFLQRLEGNLSESPDGKGIESFVMEDIGVPEKPLQTRVDYLFFSNQTYQGCFKARWVEEYWLRMQQEEIERYNLTELSYNTC